MLVVVQTAGCGPSPTPPPSSPPPIVFAPVEVLGVGDVLRGATSDDELVVRLTELEPDSLPRGAGAFELTLVDSAGSSDSVSFTGTATLTAPGSLGVTAVLTRNNVLTVEVVDTDPFNIEQVTIAGLRVSPSVTAPVGPLTLTIDACSGSLAGCAATNTLASPGVVVASP
jgi:hypothetical protein